jgi:hypothetical protein
MRSNIVLATRAHVKYQYTDFEQNLRERKEELYHEYIGDRQFYDRDERSFALEEFRDAKGNVYDEEGDNVADEIDAVISIKLKD